MCPMCLVPIPAGSRCPRCGGTPDAAATPLTARQRLRLAGPLAAALAIGAMIGAVIWAGVLARWNGSAAAAGLIGFLLLAMAAVAVAISRDALRDLLLGVALVRRMRLKRMEMEGGKGDAQTIFLAHFGDLPPFRVSPRQFGQLREGASYKVTYSPRSKICWDIRLK